MRQAFAVAVQERLAQGRLKIDTTRRRIAVNEVMIVGSWAVIGIHGEYLSGTPVAAGGGIALAQKVGGQWTIAFGGEPEFNSWLDALPNELMTPQERSFWRG